jgi:hypothetical protein
MYRISSIIWAVLLVVVAVLTLPYFPQTLSDVFLPRNASLWAQLGLYKWCAVGALGFLLLRPIVGKNITWFETFSHELTHAIVSLLFLRKIHGFHVEGSTGAVSTSGSNHYGFVPIALAPYCLPIFTYCLLSFRCLLVADSVWILDILIGVTLAFHIGCFKHQIGNHQTDINQFWLPFSYAYIVTAWVVNICIILVAFVPGYNVYTSLWRYLTALFHGFIAFF